MLHERTIDDLVGHVLANIVDRGGTHYADCEFDGQRHLVCVARTLAREVERLRAEAERLRGHLASLIDVLTSPGHAVTPSEWEDATVLAGRFGATMPDWDNESGEGSEGGDA